MDRSHAVSRCFAFLWAGLSVVLFSTAARAAAADPLLNTPPAPPIRIPAEFEPMQAAIVGWRRDVDPVLYKRLAEDVRLIILLESDESSDEIERHFTKHGVNLDNCEFIETSYGMWERDALPWFAFVDHNVPAFIHNQLSTDAWGIPQYGLAQGYPVYRSGLNVHGGNFMTDGRGTAVSLIQTAVMHAAMGDEFFERVRDYWGATRYLLVPDDKVEYPHIDCVAKLLSPDTVAVQRLPSSHKHHACLEKAAAYFNRQVTCYGTPYNVVRIDAIDDEAYINSFIVNRSVYVPVSDTQTDAAALASYEAAMPGYEIVGVHQRFGPSGQSLWHHGAALHCASMGIADERMLYIEHTPLLDRPPASRGFPIRARIFAHSGAEFVDGTPVVLWRTQADASGVWNTLPMVRVPELGEDQYEAYIPSRPVGAVVQYYLQARDASGRNETHPYIGAPQAHTFTATTLGAGVSAVSAERGADVAIYVNAGERNGRQSYRLTCSLSSDSENPQDVLPDTTVFTDFAGRLDDSGIAVARLTFPGQLTSDWVGATVCVSLELPDQQDAPADRVRIQILE